MTYARKRKARQGLDEADKGAGSHIWAVPRCMELRRYLHHRQLSFVQCRVNEGFGRKVRYRVKQGTLLYPSREAVEHGR